MAWTGTTVPYLLPYHEDVWNEGLAPYILEL